MQQIERYGVIALVFLLVTIVAVSFWGDSKSPGFWSRLTGRGAKKETPAAQTADAQAPAGSTVERAAENTLPLSPAPTATNVASAAQPGETPIAPAPTVQPFVAANVPQSLPPTRTDVVPPRVAPASERSAAGASEYVVQRGDSLIQIATRMLGQKSRWT